MGRLKINRLLVLFAQPNTNAWCTIDRGNTSVRTGSVEHLSPPENHNIVSQHNQMSFLVAACIGLASNEVALPTFDHAHDGFAWIVRGSY